MNHTFIIYITLHPVRDFIRVQWLFRVFILIYIRTGCIQDLVLMTLY